MTITKVQLQNIVAIKVVRAEVQGQLHLQQAQLQHFFIEESKMNILNELMRDLDIHDSYYQSILENLRKGEHYLES